jgi:protein gp37
MGDFSNPAMVTESPVWNVITGCDKYSEGCLNCFAIDIAAWLTGMGREPYKTHGFNVCCNDAKLNWPLALSKKPKKPRKTWLTQMGDPFHADVPESFIRKTFDVMLQVPQHRFFVLTKRADRLGKIGPTLPWRPWIWAGVTVESDKYVDRIDELRKLPADTKKFVIFEPLLGPIPEVNLDGIDWVIVGGETGKSFRPMQGQWVMDIRDQAKAKDIPFMFKHWAGRSGSDRAATVQGKIWDEYPPSVLENMGWKAG